MTLSLIDLYKKMHNDIKVDFLKPCLIYDPVAKDYIPATGYEVREDGAAILK